ncbi:MAG: M24 family metallopeptidase [Parachlamydiaceae bacterium]
MDIEKIQTQLKKFGLSGWLLYDFRRSNPLALKLLKIPGDALLSRRLFYWIPAAGTPVKLVSTVENPLLHLPGTEQKFMSWKELDDRLKALLQGQKTVAMEYSPLGRVPEISRVDGGTIDLVRSFGVEVVSSGDLMQELTSVLSAAEYESHLAAAKALDEIAAATWVWIQENLKRGITEHDVQTFMLTEMEVRGMQTDHPPICAVNAHSADPHFSPAKGGASLKSGDFVLIDLWCKKKAPGSIYADITRIGCIGKPTAKQQEIFSIVRKAQKDAVALLQTKSPVKGSEVDAACRKTIDEAGYGQYFVHRTGHNIHESDHGPGAHLDSLETCDDRTLLPGTLFSIEPGIYLPGEFGVRLEFDVYLDPNGQVLISGGQQDSITSL